jgi:aminotransferase
MCDIGSWGYPNDVEFAKFLVKDIGVATVPGSSFFGDPRAGKDIIRFTFCKKEETLRAAEERLARLNSGDALRIHKDGDGCARPSSSLPRN